jgi:hypothetical protein
MLALAICMMCVSGVAAYVAGTSSNTGLITFLSFFSILMFMASVVTAVISFDKPIR